MLLHHNSKVNLVILFVIDMRKLTVHVSLYTSDTPWLLENIAKINFIPKPGHPNDTHYLEQLQPPIKYRIFTKSQELSGKNMQVLYYFYGQSARHGR